MRWQELEKQNCSVARTLSVIGDRWTPLILRECFFGVTRFDGFEKRLGIPRRVLSERLKMLVAKGVLRREPYQDHSRRFDYLLTERGRDLRAILLTMIAWGEKHMPLDGPSRQIRHLECGAVMTPVLHCSECGEAIGPDDVTTEPGGLVASTIA